jgi:hypothetical protein
MLPFVNGTLSHQRGNSRHYDKEGFLSSSQKIFKFVSSAKLLKLLNEKKEKKRRRLGELPNDLPLKLDAHENRLHNITFLSSSNIISIQIYVYRSSNTWRPVQLPSQLGSVH